MYIRGSVKILFAELPAPLRVGGLEKACRELEHALLKAGHAIRLTEGSMPATDVDLVHFHGLWSPAHARLARRARARGIPIVTSPHGMLEPWAMEAKRLKKLLYFRIVEQHRLRKSAAVLATADQEGQRIRVRVPGARVEVLPLGSFFNQEPGFEAARSQLGWPPDERILLYLSRVHPKKGLQELLQSLHDVTLPPDQKWRLVVVGDGPKAYVDACHREARGLENKIQIDWHGAIWGEDKWRYLKGADLMCLPTYSENFGLIVLEALEVGTPVLTTIETPWQPVAEAGFGWVTSVGRKAFVEALQDFAGKPRPCTEDRAAAAKWARTHYDWDRLALRYTALYEEILHTRSSPRS